MVVIPKPRKNRVPAAVRKFQAKNRPTEDTSQSPVATISMLNSRVEKMIKKVGLNPDFTKGFDEACTIFSVFAFVCLIILSIFYPKPDKTTTIEFVNFIGEKIPKLSEAGDFYSQKFDKSNLLFNKKNSNIFLGTSAEALKNPEIIFYVETDLDDNIQNSDSARSTIASAFASLNKYVQETPEDEKKVSIVIAAGNDKKIIEAHENAVKIIIKPYSGIGGLAILPLYTNDKFTENIALNIEGLCKKCYKNVFNSEVIEEKKYNHNELPPLVLETFSGKTYDKIFKKHVRQYNSRIYNIRNSENPTEADKEALFDNFEIENVLLNASASMIAPLKGIIDEYVAITKKTKAPYSTFIKELVTLELSNIDNKLSKEKNVLKNIEYLRTSRSVSAFGKQVILQNAAIKLIAIIASTIVFIDIFTFHLDFGLINRRFVLTTDFYPLKQKTIKAENSEDSKTKEMKPKFFTFSRFIRSMIKIIYKTMLIIYLSGITAALCYIATKYVGKNFSIEKLVFNLANTEMVLFYILVAISTGTCIFVFACLNSTSNLSCMKGFTEKYNHRAEFFTYFHASTIVLIAITFMMINTHNWDYAFSCGQVTLLMGTLCMATDVMQFAGVFKNKKKNVINALLDIENNIWWKNAMLAAVGLIAIIIVVLVPLQLSVIVFNSTSNYSLTKVIIPLIFVLTAIYIAPISSYSIYMGSRWVASILCFTAVIFIYSLYTKSTYNMSDSIVDYNTDASGILLSNSFGTTTQTNFYINCNNSDILGYNCKVTQGNLLTDYIKPATLLLNPTKDENGNTLFKINALGKVIEAELDKKIAAKVNSNECIVLPSKMTDIVKGWRGNVVIRYCKQ